MAGSLISVRGLPEPAPRLPAYTAPEILSITAAAELGSRGITVNVVSPGLTETEMLEKVMDAESQQALIGQTPLGRLGQPEDIADVVSFLASPDARWVTGQIIGANGGLR